jgi:hypothetical protein
MALGGPSPYHDVRYSRNIRPLRNEDSKSKAKLVGSKRSKRRNKAKGRSS